MNLAIKEYLGKSALFEVSLVDLPDPVEWNLASRYTGLMTALHPKNMAECNGYLLEQASRGPDTYSDIMAGLLYGILTEGGKSSTYFQWMHSIVNDGWTCLANHLKYFTFTRYVRLREESRRQLVWLVGRLVGLYARGCDGLLVGLFRQIKSSQESTWLIRQLVEILSTNQQWLYQQTGLIPFALYAFLRLLSEEGIGDAGMIQVCVGLMTERFKECSVLGRDLVRCLQDVWSIPAFNSIWTWLLAGSPAPLVQLLLLPTPKRYFAVRLTPLMETELLFLMESVKVGKQGRYEKWFADAHLERASDSLIADVIRFVVAAHHPSNAVIASNVVQRWSVVGWLLKRISTNYGAANAKLALFYDWLFFDPNLDSIMNIEPAILLMARSVGKNSNMASTLIEFLVFARSQYYPPLERHIAKSLDLSMSVAIRSGVIAGLDGLFQSPMLEDSIKSMLCQLFPSSQLSSSQLPSLPSSQADNQDQPPPADVPRLTSQKSQNLDFEYLYLTLQRIDFLLGKSVSISTASRLFANLSSLVSTIDAATRETLNAPLAALFSKVFKNPESSWLKGLQMVFPDTFINKDNSVP